MRGVWSFWTRPYRAHHYSFWLSDWHHLLAWVLSVETARRHVGSTALITDDAGAEMLVDGIGLEFDDVSTVLNALDDEDPDWWCLGKLYAYRAQTEPFVHIDSDCFLWHALPERMTRADLLAQSPEPFVYGGSTYYRPDVVGRVLDSVGGWMPEELRWYAACRGEVAINCGVFGGNRLGFIRRYADLAIRLVQDPANRPGWRSLTDKVYYENVLAEQYVLGACIAYAAAGLDPSWQPVDAEYLFDSMAAAFESDATGFTHLIGYTKSNQHLAQRLEARVRREYPAHYARCARYMGRRGSDLAGGVADAAGPLGADVREPRPVVHGDAAGARPVVNQEV